MIPVISIVIPVYNEEKYLPICLEALTHQDFTLPYEIIVVDNNSTDKTAEIARKFKVKVIAEKNQGLVFARQRGLLEAKAEIVANCDADTKPPKSWLTKIYQSLEDPRVVAVSGRLEMIDGPYWYRLHNDIWLLIIKFFTKLTGKAYFIHGPNNAFRKKLFLETGGYDTRIILGEDEWGLLTKMSKKGQVVYNQELINYSSGRRSKDGFFEYFFYDLPIKYGLNYFLGSILKRPITKSYTNVR